MDAEDLNEKVNFDLDQAVLRELLRIGPTVSHLYTQYRCSDAERDSIAERQRNRFFDEDEDWQDIRRSRRNIRSGHFEPMILYDGQRKTIYHINNWLFGERFAGKEDDRYDGNATPALEYLSPTDDEIQTAVKEALHRLFLGNDHFGPSGYYEWMARSLERRFPIANGQASDIPGYGNLCKQCLHVLSHSVLLYRAVSRCRIRSSKPVSMRRTVWRADRDLFREIFNHHGTIQALYASAMKGCHLCSLLTAPCEAGNICPHQDSQMSYLLKVKAPKFKSGNKVDIMVHALGVFSRTISMGPHGYHREGPSTLKHLRTDAPEVMQQAKQWLSQCLEEHSEECVSQLGFLPSRLIKVTSSHGSPLAAKLVLRENLPNDTQYLTLSHCWGKLNMPTLTTDNFDNLQVNLPVHNLTKTFRESLQSTRWFGYEYIWIDSLCILQDSKTDWKNESAMMGLIYRHSTCTLAAAGAASGEHGLFFERNALIFTDCPLFTCALGTESRYDFFARHLHHWPEPLSERAWVVQEQVLSMRTIRFGSDRISWACRKGMCVEGPDTNEYTGLSGLTTQFTSLLKSSDSRDRYWDKLVIWFSGRSLTYPADKWPAFRGLAAEVAKAQRRTLVHGLWYDEICYGLLWRAQDPQMGTVDCGEPSWSWLNFNGRIFLPERSNDIDNTVEINLKSSVSGSKVPRDRPEAHTLVSQCGFNAHESAQPGDLEMALRAKKSLQLDKFHSHGEDDILQITTFITPCKFTGERSYGDSPALKEFSLTLVENQLHTPPQNESMKGRWWPDNLPVSRTHAWAMHLVNDSIHGDYYRESGLVIVPVKGRPGYWKRVGSYGFSSIEEPDEMDIEPWPWAKEKEIIFLI